MTGAGDVDGGDADDYKWESDSGAYLSTDNSIGYIYGASAANAMASDLNSYLTNHGCQNQYLFLTGYVPYGAKSDVDNSITKAVSTAVTDLQNQQTIDGCMILNVLDLVSGVDVGDGGALGAALSGTTGFSNIGMKSTDESPVNVHTDTTCVGTLSKGSGDGGVAINAGYSGFNVPIANAFATKLKAACGGTNAPFADSSDAIAVGAGVSNAVYAAADNPDPGDLERVTYTLSAAKYHLLGTCTIGACDTGSAGQGAQAPNVRLINGAAGDLVDFSILPYAATASGIQVANIISCFNSAVAQLSLEDCVKGDGYCPIITGDQWAGGGDGVLYDDTNDPGLVYVANAIDCT